ncbi:DMT family transporter [Ruegeria meonggei]|uniref:Riboflavin transporter n=1 Tax=Ruegeria meonggei TaxID=1446476 RepID=A0A1X6YWS6_9RHOB|nr:DMT family transporter [Ruegeria meonggei]SLN33616.1 Riboflavin transporter [Ruegeria meonggei]
METANGKIKGAIWILIAAFCFALMNALAKEIPQTDGGGIPVLQLALARYAVAALVLLPLVLSRKSHWKPTHPERYFVRTIAGFGGIVLMFVAVNFVPLAAATAIGFTSPIFAMLFAAWFLSERMNRRRWAIGCLGLIGAIVIAAPEGSGVSWAGLIPFAAAIFMGAEVTSIKWLSQSRDHAITIIFYSNLAGALLALIGAFPVWVEPTLHQLGLLTLLGTVAVIGQFCVLRGARLAEASFLAPLFYASLVYSALLGFVFFAEVPALTTVIGCLIILSCAFLLTREGRTQKA